MRYLIIDKRHRVKGSREGIYPTAVKRILEELNKKNISCEFAYLDQIEFLLKNGETGIKINKRDIAEYSHIIFRGHNLHNSREYETKRLIIDCVEQLNSSKSDKHIQVQNSETIKKFPYYNKIFTAQFCSTYKIPYFDTYYHTGGDYSDRRDILNEYPLIIKEYAGVNRVDKKLNKRVIKKNVYKLDSVKDLEQKNLKRQDLSNFFLQDFTDTALDIRTFVKLGKVVGGWKREAEKGFMTVNKGIYSMYNKPDSKIKEIAEKTANLLDADFIAVDFMFKDNKPYLQEISLHPGFKAYETKIKDGEPINIAEAIITAFKYPPF